MEVMKLSDAYLDAFKTYCRQYKTVHDESYLYPEDIDDFKISENPTVILVDQGRIIGCLSFIMEDYFLKAGKSRIRIFHCEATDPRHYKMLLRNMPALNLDYIEMFLPNDLLETTEIIKALGFDYFRSSYVMVRKDQAQLKAVFPEDFTLRGFVHGQDEEAYADIRNAAFRNLKGSETPITPEDVQKFSQDQHLIQEGIQILCYKDQPVGIIRMLLEEDETGRYSFVAPLAIHPDYHGMGLGSNLLKAGISVGYDNGLRDCMLSVNAENDKALALYRRLGFEVDMAVSNYRMTL